MVSLFTKVAYIVMDYNETHYKLFNFIRKSTNKRKIVKSVKESFSKLVDVEYLRAEIAYDFLEFTRIIGTNDNTGNKVVLECKDTEGSLISYTLQFMGYGDNGISPIPKFQIWKSYSKGDLGCVQVINYDREIMTPTEQLISDDFKRINNKMYEIIVNYVKEELK